MTPTYFGIDSLKISIDSLLSGIDSLLSGIDSLLSILTTLSGLAIGQFEITHSISENRQDVYMKLMLDYILTEIKHVDFLICG